MQVVGLGGVLVGRIDDGHVELLGVVPRREPHVLDVPGYGDILAGGRGDAAHDLGLLLFAPKGRS